MSTAPFLYTGSAAMHPNIKMDLYLTAMAGTYDATGTIEVGSFHAQVKGTLAAGALNATVAYALQYSGTAARVMAAGKLGGAMGAGMLSVSTGPVLVGQSSQPLSFTLYPVHAPSPPPPPPALLLPATRSLAGEVAFGYTKLALALELKLNGASYEITGSIKVNQIKPTVVQAALGVSGALTPGVQGELTITGAPAGSTPRFTGTLGPLGAPFQGLLSGIPKLLITGLYVNAT